MIWGMTTSTFTLVHVVLSLAGSASGAIVVFGLLICATAALYLNVLVAVVQAFLKVPVLSAMAPGQTEPPYVITQVVVLLLFVVLTVLAVKRFRPGPAQQAP